MEHTAVVPACCLSCSRTEGELNGAVFTCNVQSRCAEELPSLIALGEVGLGKGHLGIGKEVLSLQGSELKLP